MSKAMKKKPARKTKSAAGRMTAKAARAATLSRSSARQTTDFVESAMADGKNKFDRFARDAAKHGREHADAVMVSGNVFVKGIEDITKTYMGWAQDSAEKNAQAAKALLACRTINELAQTQNKWLQQSFDDFMTGAIRVSELGVKIATDAFEPINDQFGKTLKKATDIAA